MHDIMHLPSTMAVSKALLIVWIYLVITIAEQVEHKRKTNQFPRAFAKPFNVDTEFDCAIKELAWQYAKKLLPQVS